MSLVLCGISACTSPQSAPVSSPLRTQLLLLNAREGSGWVAYKPDGNAPGEETEYRISLTNVGTGEVLYESGILLEHPISSHAFELSGNDPLLQATFGTVDQQVLAVADPAPAPRPSNFPAISVLAASATSVTFTQGSERVFAVGQRFYVRTPPRTAVNPINGETIVLSEGFIAALFEIAQVDGAKVHATLLSGEMPPEGRFEWAD